MAKESESVLLLLQKMQQDMTDMHEVLESKLDDISAVLSDHGEALADLKRHLTFHLGLTIQDRTEIGELGTRVTALESKT